jgi:WD40 repeat protein
LNRTRLRATIPTPLAEQRIAAGQLLPGKLSCQTAVGPAGTHVFQPAIDWNAMNMNGFSDRDKRLRDILAAYCAAVAAGQPPDRQALLARHPDLATDLAAFFANEAQAASAQGAEAPTLAPQPAEGRDAVAPRGKYFGDYELVAELARGGMGVVWRARQLSLNRPVALKMILAGQLASAADVQRFQTEAEAAAQLDHPHIVPIYEIGEHDGQPFFSMKLIEGPSLATWLTPLWQAIEADPQRRSRSSLRTFCREVVQILIGVARAVHHAHQRGILHRDLKPANVLLDADGQPHVTDFGLAKRVQGAAGMTQTGAIVGTPSYMAPEQARAEKGVSTAVDVYSLGAILYEVLTGRPPFRAETPLDTLLQVLEQEPLRPRELQENLDGDLETICLKCLEKEPRKRYDSAAALADELERWQSGEPVRARPVGRVERGWRWCRRKPLVAGLLVAIGLLLFLVAGVAAVGYMQTVQALNREAEQREEAERQREREAEQRAEAERQRELARNAESKALAAEATARRMAADEGRARQEARRNLYIANVHLARQAWESAQVDHMLQLLEEAERRQPGDEDLRGFEWRYLWRLGHPEVQTLQGHSSAVESVAFSPDGQRLASASGDGDIKLWDTFTGKQLRTFPGSTYVFNMLTSVAFSPDGQHLASGSGIIGKAGEIKLWEVASGKLLRTIKGHTNTVSGVAFSPDGQRLASASWDGTVRIWDVTSGKELFTLKGHAGEVNSVTFSADGQRLASAGRSGMDAQTKQVVYGEVKLWEVASGKELLTLKGHAHAVTSVAISPDGRRLASASHDQTVKLWETATRKELRTLEGHTNWVNSVAFSPDGQRLASASRDRTVKLWEVASGRELLTLKGHTDDIRSVAFSPDGKHLASGGDRTVKLWETATDDEVRILKAHTYGVSSVAFSPDGQRLASASSGFGQSKCEVKLWEVATGKELLILQGHTASVKSVAFSPDGERLASASTDQTVKIWELASGRELLILKGHDGKVWNVTFSPDGRSLASASDDGVRLWDVASGKELRTLGGSKILGALYSGPRKLDHQLSYCGGPGKG